VIVTQFAAMSEVVVLVYAYPIVPILKTDDIALPIHSETCDA